jgi:chromosome segregation ATPase
MGLFKNKITQSEAALNTLQDQLDTLQTSYDALQAEVSDAHQLAATHLAEFQRVDAENKELQTRIETLQTELSEASKDGVEFELEVSKEAASIVANLGHDEALDVCEDEEPEMNVCDTFKSLKGQAKIDFYNSHKAEIHKAIKA